MSVPFSNMDSAFEVKRPQKISAKLLNGRNDALVSRYLRLHSHRHELSLRILIPDRKIVGDDEKGPGKLDPAFASPGKSYF
jgi:hypothetical protein